MSIVRRPSRTTVSCSIPEDGELVATPRYSRQTRLKAEATKRYLEGHFQSLIEETQARKERFNDLREKINSSDLQQNDRDSLIQQFETEETQYSRLSRTRLKIDRYQRIKLIGRGGFGEVWLAMEKSTSKLYALKILRKTDIILRDQLLNVRTERDVLSVVDNPWVVRLHCSFQDAERLYLVLEYVPGGDIMTALIKQSKFTEEAARFFCGEITLALFSLHSKEFLHRDLKPDNVLIAADGHIKLTDFGLSTRYVKPDNRLQELLDELQEVMLEESHTSGIQCVPHHARGNAIGTCDYTAPEVLLGHSPTTASDYWSLGVILYEMLYGFTPFYGKSPQETALRIVHWKRSRRFPADPNVSPQAVDLLTHLLCDAEDRYGYEQIVSHPFFSGFDFQNVMGNQPPMVPIIKYPTDTSHFDNFEPIIDQAEKEIPCSDLARFAFLGYTYKQRPQSMTLARLSGLPI